MYLPQFTTWIKRVNHKENLSFNCMLKKRKEKEIMSNQQ